MPLACVKPAVTAKRFLPASSGASRAGTEAWASCMPPSTLRVIPFRSSDAHTSMVASKSPAWPIPACIFPFQAVTGASPASAKTKGPDILSPNMAATNPPAPSSASTLSARTAGSPLSAAVTSAPALTPSIRCRRREDTRPHAGSNAMIRPLSSKTAFSPRTSVPVANRSTDTRSTIRD